MKTILLIIGLIAFSAAGSYAQTKDCCCKKKTAYHAKHRKTTKYNAVATTNKPLKTPCSTYTSKNGIVVTECPDNFYADNGPYKWNDSIFDMNGNINYVVEKTYSGYYPDYSINAYIYNGPLASAGKDLVVSSSAFTNYGVLPLKYTCEGEQASPPLNVTNIPAGTQSLAIVMYDTHATAKGGMTYWMMWDLDTTGFIPENFVSDHESMNSAKEYGYQPVCPKAGTHYYHFMVYALDTKLLEGKHTTRATLENAMRGHILSKGELVATYNRHLE